MRAVPTMRPLRWPRPLRKALYPPPGETTAPRVMEMTEHGGYLAGGGGEDHRKGRARMGGQPVDS